MAEIQERIECGHGGSIALEYLAKDMKSDKEVVMACVQHHGYALQHAAEEMRKDKEVVMASVQALCYPGIALQFAAEGMKKDKEVVMAAVRHNGRALECASGDQRTTREST